MAHHSNHNNHNNNHALPAAREPMFSEHLKPTAARRGLASGLLLAGLLRNPRKRGTAYVSVPGLGHDIFIDSLPAINRALEGDWVAVELVPEAQWRVRQKEEGAPTDAEDEDAGAGKKKDGAGGGGGGGGAAGPAAAAALAALPGLRKLVWQPQVETGSTAGEEGEGPAESKDDGPAPRAVPEAWAASSKTPEAAAAMEVAKARTDGGKLQPCGVVRSILVENAGLRSSVVGFLRRQDGKEGSEPIAPDAFLTRFVPLDSRLPYMMVHRTSVEEVDSDFLADPAAAANTLYVASVSHWTTTKPFPAADLICSLGAAGGIDVETSALLLQHGVRCAEYEAIPAAAACLAPFQAPGGWQIPATERAKRVDLRGYRIFTCDGVDTRDIDDALHVRRISPPRLDAAGHEVAVEADGVDPEAIYEVGVHIADVSYFVKHGSALDREAASRATSTYLVNMVVHMLPSLLSQDLCSLNPQVERLAFSCVWRMKGSGELMPGVGEHAPRYHKSIIKSVAKMDYYTAERMVTGEISKEVVSSPVAALSEAAWETARRPAGWDAAEVQGSAAGPCAELYDDIRVMAGIARRRRLLREAAGALTVDNAEVKFERDGAGHVTGLAAQPARVSTYQMIEEYMLLANFLVAQKMLQGRPDMAVLLRHPSARAEKIGPARALGEEFGFHVSAGNSWLQSRAKEAAAAMPPVGDVLEMMLRRAAQGAYYLVASEMPPANFGHFALAIPYYTHFTSPIRRYGDLMVHRVLGAILEAEAVAAGGAAAGAGGGSDAPGGAVAVPAPVAGGGAKLEAAAVTAASDAPTADEVSALFAAAAAAFAESKATPGPAGKAAAAKSRAMREEAVEAQRKHLAAKRAVAAVAAPAAMPRGPGTDTEGAVTDAGESDADAPKSEAVKALYARAAAARYKAKAAPTPEEAAEIKAEAKRLQKEADAAWLKECSDPFAKVGSVAALIAQCRQCTERRRAANNAEKRSREIHFIDLVRNNGPQEVDGVVTEMIASGTQFAVFVPAWDVEVKVSLDRCGWVGKWDAGARGIVVRPASHADVAERKAKREAGRGGGKGKKGGPGKRPAAPVAEGGAHAGAGGDGPAVAVPTAHLEDADAAALHLALLASDASGAETDGEGLGGYHSEYPSESALETDGEGGVEEKKGRAKPAGKAARRPAPAARAQETEAAAAAAVAAVAATASGGAERAPALTPVVSGGAGLQPTPTAVWASLPATPSRLGMQAGNLPQVHPLPLPLGPLGPDNALPSRTIRVMTQLRVRMVEDRQASGLGALGLQILGFKE